MARKFIVTGSGKFIMGNVELHLDLLPRKRSSTEFHTVRQEVKEDTITGGGRWDVDNENKILKLWGASVDYGYAEPENIKNAIHHPETWISQSLEGYDVYHSPIISNEVPDINTFTKLTVVPE